MTALALALQRAGIAPAHDRLGDVVGQVLAMTREQWRASAREEWDDHGARERLLEVAMQTVREWPRNWDGAKQALYAAVKDDPALLWAMFEPWRLVAAQRLLTEAAAKLREQEKMALDRNLVETRRSARTADRPTSSTTPNQPTAANDRPRDAMGPKEHDDHARVAHPHSGMDAVAKVARLSMLDTFRINGQAIGDCTAKEARGWAGSRERDARFVRMLTANLPDDEPIRKYRDATEADSLYERALKDD